MIQISSPITLGIVVAFLGLVGSLIILTKKSVGDKLLFYLIPVGAGFILGVSIFDMIPKSFELSSHAGLFILAGYAMIYFFEHVFSGHFSLREEAHPESISKKTAWMVMVSLIFLTFVDGVAISSAFSVNYLLGFVVFMSVSLYIVPVGLTIASVMLASGRGKMGALAASFVLALSTIAGSMWSATFTQYNKYLLGFTAGVLLYLSATNLIPEVAKKKNLVSSGLLLFGVLLYYGSRLLLINVGIG